MDSLFRETDLIRNVLTWIQKEKYTRSLATCSLNIKRLVSCVEQDICYWIDKLYLQYDFRPKTLVSALLLQDLYKFICYHGGDLQKAFQECAKNNRPEGVLIISREEKLYSIVKDVPLQTFKKTCKSKLVNIIDMLLSDDRVDPSTNQNDAIIQASMDGQLEIVNRLLQDVRVDPSTQYNDALIEASAQGHVNIVDRLLQDERVNPADYDNDAIGKASLHGHVAMVYKLLQDPRVDPSDNDNYAIMQASRFGHWQIVELLLQDIRVDPATQNNYALRKACMSGYWRVVDVLLRDARVDPSVKNNFLISAAYTKGYMEIVWRLLQDARVINNLSKEQMEKYQTL